jgi:hypothetical protein
MDEAIQNIPPQPSFVIAVLARQAAIKAVKEQLRQQGLKPAYMAKREIVGLAEDYLVEHRRLLLAQAWERVCSAPELRELYDREQRKRQRLLERISANLHSERRPEPQGLSLCKSHERNGEINDRWLCTGIDGRPDA